MTVLDKLKAFFKRPKAEAKGEKKAAERPETRATETSEEKREEGA